MGMDIYGRKPMTDDGRYIGIQWHQWHPILMLCLTTGLVDDELIEEMRFNDGCGVENEETCRQMAGLLEMGLSAYLGNCDAGTKSEPEVSKLKYCIEYFFAHPDYSISQTQIEAWIRFLKYCRGFRVW